MQVITGISIFLYFVQPDVQQKPKTRDHIPSKNGSKLSTISSTKFVKGQLPVTSQ